MREDGATVRLTLVVKHLFLVKSSDHSNLVAMQLVGYGLCITFVRR